jgi:uncharacterized protein
MQCHVYKSLKRADTYVYLCQRDDFEPLPTALRERLGELRWVMALDLHPERRLARVEAASVLRDLHGRGYHLQLPPVDPLLADPNRADALD